MNATTKLLLSSKNNIPINTQLAVEIGLNEAIVLRQVYYWVEHYEAENKNFIEGKYWVYNSMKQWRSDNFPFMSEKTIERAFSSLRKKNLILVGDYSQDRMKRPNWYTINDKEFDKLIKKITGEDDNSGEQKEESKETGKDNSDDTNSLSALRQNVCMQSDTPTDCYNIYNNINNTYTENTIRDYSTENTPNSFSNEKDNSKETLELHNSPVPEKQESDIRISMSLGIKQKQSKEKPLKDMPTRAKEIADSLVDDKQLSWGVQVCIEYFLGKYKQKNRKEHLPLRNETLQSVVEVMLSSLSVPHDEDLENRYQCVFYPLVSEASEWEDRKEVIDKYFDTDFREKCDYSLVHFTQRDIITHVMQKCSIGEDIYWFYSESVD